MLSIPAPGLVHGRGQALPFAESRPASCTPPLPDTPALDAFQIGARDCVLETGRVYFHWMKAMNPQPTARQRKTKTGASSPPNVYYIYHWNRIIGAFAAVALLIGLAGFAFFAWLAPASAPTDDAETETALAPSAHSEPSSDIVAETPLMPATQPEPASEPVAPEHEAVAPARFAREPMPVFDEVAQPGAPPPSESEGDTPAPIEAMAPSGDETPVPIEAAPPVEDISPASIAAAVPSETQSSRVFLPPDTRVNLRAAPSLSSPVLRILDARAELQLLGTTEAFFQVRTAERIVGWVSRDYASPTPYAIPDHSGNTE